MTRLKKRGRASQGRAPSLPTYRLHRPSGRAVVTIAGKDHYLGAFNSPESRRAYDQLMAELLTRGPAAVAASRRPAGALTIEELCDAYWQSLEQRHGVAEAERRFGRIKLAQAPLKELYGTSPAAAFNPKALRVVQREMVKGDLVRSLVNQRVQFLRRMFRWAVAEELVPGSLSHALEAVENLRRGDFGVREGRDVRPVAWEHVEPVLGRVSRQVAAMIQLQWFTGMRSGEVVQLRPADLVRDDGPWQYRPRHHKTEHHGKDRVVWLGPQAQDVLRPFLDRVPQPDPERLLFSPQDAQAEQSVARRAARKSKMTPSQARRQRKPDPKRAPREGYETDSFRRAIKRAIDAINEERTEAAAKAGVKAELLPEWFPHQLRHAAATRIRKEFGLEAARVVLGHSTPGITAVYAEVDCDRARDVMKSCG